MTGFSLKRRGLVVSAIAATVGTLIGCDFPIPGGAMSDSSALRAEFDGLEPLGDGYVYEGWLIVDGGPVSTGRFSVDETGQPDPAEFDVNDDDAESATLFVLTIEPADGDDPAPADTHVLAGAWDGNTADLSVGHEAAIGDDFATASGAYILNTPSSADTDEDFDQGIWWLDPASGPGASLELPALPAGWSYEGWVVGPDGPISTGRFTSADVSDSDDAGDTSGSDGAPPFPGQDFVDPPIVLTDFAAVISVEPEPDDSAAPFAIKPLIDMTIEDVGIGVLQAMGNAADGTPTGKVETVRE